MNVNLFFNFFIKKEMKEICRTRNYMKEWRNFLEMVRIFFRNLVLWKLQGNKKLDYEFLPFADSYSF